MMGKEPFCFNALQESKIRGLMLYHAGISGGPSNRTGRKPAAERLADRDVSVRR